LHVKISALVLLLSTTGITAQREGMYLTVETDSTLGALADRVKHIDARAL
jgi:hypothetical protein